MFLFKVREIQCTQGLAALTMKSIYFLCTSCLILKVTSSAMLVLPTPAIVVRLLLVTLSNCTWPTLHSTAPESHSGCCVAVSHFSVSSVSRGTKLQI